jgi:anti-sigma-K factor RskA
VQRASRAPVLVAVLLTDASRPAAVVNAFADGRIELIPLDTIPVPPGKALEIWTLWDRARGPVSVGLIDAARRVNLRLEGLPTPGPNQLFEITLEPATGSPTGRPTGPILMKGTTSATL